MLFPLIKIVDNELKDKSIRIVGTNSHDVLCIDKKTGGIQYLNLQCCEGTTKFDGEGTYSFIGENDKYLPYSVVEFVTFEKLADIYIEQIKASCEIEKSIRELVKKIADERNSIIKENGLDKDDGVVHTAGNLI